MDELWIAALAEPFPLWRDRNAHRGQLDLVADRDLDVDVGVRAVIDAQLELGRGDNLFTELVGQHAERIHFEWGGGDGLSNVIYHLEGVDLESLQHSLFERDIAVLYTPGGSYSSVPENGAIRIAIFATHTKEQIDRLVGEIERLI